MEALIQELIPNAPNMGLYVHPHIPEKKVLNAIKDYAPNIAQEDVLALYDATLLGGAKDGVVFTTDRFVFQNNDLEAPQTIHYENLVNVVETRKLLSGRKVAVTINRGRATVEVKIDFSGKPDAAAFVAQFLHEAMQRGASAEMRARRSTPSPVPTDAPPEDQPFPRPGIETDPEAVRAALDELHEQELLSAEDWHKLRDAIGLT